MEEKYLDCQVITREEGLIKHKTYLVYAEEECFEETFFATKPIKTQFGEVANIKSYEIISFDEKFCIINWQMTRTMTKTDTKQEIDGIFQISLNG